jgi:hypothetical protein
LTNEIRRQKRKIDNMADTFNLPGPGAAMAVTIFAAFLALGWIGQAVAEIGATTIALLMFLLISLLMVFVVFTT